MVDRSGTATVDGIAIYFSVPHLLVSRMLMTKSETDSQRDTRLLIEQPTPPKILITMVTFRFGDIAKYGLDNLS